MTTEVVKDVGTTTKKGVQTRRMLRLSRSVGDLQVDDDKLVNPEESPCCSEA